MYPARIRQQAGRQAHALEVGIDAQMRRQQEETRALVAVLGATHQDSLQVGQHGRRTLAQMVHDSGFSDAGELDAVVRLSDGRAYR